LDHNLCFFFNWSDKSNGSKVADPPRDESPPLAVCLKNRATATFPNKNLLFNETFRPEISFQERMKETEMATPVVVPHSDPEQGHLLSEGAHPAHPAHVDHQHAGHQHAGEKKRGSGAALKSAIALFLMVTTAKDLSQCELGSRSYLVWVLGIPGPECIRR